MDYRVGGAELRIPSDVPMGGVQTFGELASCEELEAWEKSRCTFAAWASSV